MAPRPICTHPLHYQCPEQSPPSPSASCRNGSRSVHMGDKPLVIRSVDRVYFADVGAAAIAGRD